MTRAELLERLIAIQTEMGDDEISDGKIASLIEDIKEEGIFDVHRHLVPSGVTAAVEALHRDYMSEVFAMLSTDVRNLVRDDVERYKNDASADQHATAKIAANALDAIEICEAEDAAAEAPQH